VIALGVTHVPEPSHADGAVTLLVMASHTEGLHCVPSGQSRQDPFPSHEPSCWQVVCPSVGQEGCPDSGADPFGTGEHLPTLPIRLHAWHESAQVVSQQTPSTHPPAVPHSVEEVHESPGPLGPLPSATSTSAASPAAPYASPLTVPSLALPSVRAPVSSTAPASSAGTDASPPSPVSEMAEKSPSKVVQPETAAQRDAHKTKEST
jgi:hypothetical protein